MAPAGETLRSVYDRVARIVGKSAEAVRKDHERVLAARGLAKTRGRRKRADTSS